MKILFFDCEFASSLKSLKICSFGYVLTDSNFKILKEDDLLINPKCKFDSYVLDHVLYYDEKTYLNNPTFKEVYPKLKELINEADLLIGFSLNGDLKALNDEALRYHLKPLEFNFYDLKNLTSILKSKDNPHISLKTASILLNCTRQNDKHRSLEDAIITMEVFEKLLKKRNLKIDEYFSLAEGKFYLNRIQVKEPKEIIFKNNETKIVKSYAKLLNEKYHKLSKKIGFSVVFENTNPKLLLSFLTYLKDYDLSYVTTVNDLDYYVTYSLDKKVCPKEKIVRSNIKTKILTVEEFMKMINYQDENLDKRYQKVYKKVIDYEHKIFISKKYKRIRRKHKEKN